MLNRDGGERVETGARIADKNINKKCQTKTKTKKNVKDKQNKMKNKNKKDLIEIYDCFYHVSFLPFYIYFNKTICLCF